MSYNPDKIKKVVLLGVQGENLVTKIEFDMSAWAELYPNGSYSVMLQRPTEVISYNVNTTFNPETKILTWLVSSIDTAIEGEGYAEVVCLEGEKIDKSTIFDIYIDPCLNPPGEVPDPYEDWYQRMLQVEANTKQYRDESIEAAGTAVSAKETAVQAKDAAVAAQEQADRDVVTTTQLKDQVLVIVQEIEGDRQQILINKNDIADLKLSKVDKEAGKGLSTNDFTNELKTKLVNIDLTPYALIADMETYGKSLVVSIDSQTYVMTMLLKDANGNTLSTQSVDLPLETMVVGGSYDDTTKSLILTLNNGQTITIPVADLVSGLVSETQLATILADYATKAELSAHTGNTSNPHAVTKAQVGLGNCDNTSDANKPVSTAQQAEFLKAKYHLGAFDTVDTSNADYDLITRKTGYLTTKEIEKATWSAYGSSYRYYAVFSDFQKPASDNTKGNIVCNVLTTVYKNNITSDYYLISALDSSTSPNGFIVRVATNITSVDLLKQWFVNNNITIEYETIASYTEKVIKNQPINTLDVNGSEFLRDEWEKQLNLFSETNDDVINNHNIADDGTFQSNSSFKCILIKIEQNKMYCFNAPDNIPVVAYFSSKPTTTSVSYDYARHYDNPFIAPISGWAVIQYRTDYTGTYMVNYGDHAYPYQSYNGAIVHKKELQDNVDELNDKIDHITNEESIDVTDTKIIKVSGLDDNLAIPEESHVEINKVVCGSLARNQLVKFLNGTKDYELTLNGEYDFVRLTNYFTLDSSHTYAIRFQCSELATWSTFMVYFSTNLGNFTLGDHADYYAILSNRSESGCYLKCKTYNNYVLNNVKIKCNIYDLTINYGSTIANYLASLSEYNALAWLRANDPNIFKYRDYGSAIVNTNGDLINTNRNVWDEQWELGGYNNSTGAKTGDIDRIRSKNKFSIIPNATYYGYKGGFGYLYAYFYDKNDNFISYAGITNSTFIVPINASYMSLGCSTGYGTTYNNDVCINVSDTSFNGQYVSHKQETQTLPSGYGIPKLDSNNKLTFDGDEIIGDKFNSKYDIVDLSTLSWSHWEASTGLYAWSASVNGMAVAGGYSVSPNAIAEKFLIRKQSDGNAVGCGFITSTSPAQVFLFQDQNNNAPTGHLIYEKAQISQEILDNPVHPMALYKGGYELQTSDVPYTLQRNYDISIKDQVVTNVEVDRAQSAAIANLDNNKQDKLLVFTNVSASSWVSDNTYNDYGYKCDITCAGITANSIVEVIFGLTEALSGDYAPICVTSANMVTIYSKVNTSITIPTIKEI